MRRPGPLAAAICAALLLALPSCGTNTADPGRPGDAGDRGAESCIDAPLADGESCMYAAVTEVQPPLGRARITAQNGQMRTVKISVSLTKPERVSIGRLDLVCPRLDIGEARDRLGRVARVQELSGDITYPSIDGVTMSQHTRVSLVLTMRADLRDESRSLVCTAGGTLTDGHFLAPRVDAGLASFRVLFATRPERPGTSLLRGLQVQVPGIESCRVNGVGLQSSGECGFAR